MDLNLDNQAENAVDEINGNLNDLINDDSENDLSENLTNEADELAPKDAEPEIEDGKQSEPNDMKEVEIDDWTKDGRYEKMWKDPNDLYKSYRNAENQLKQLGEFKSRTEMINNLFSEKGLDPEKMSDYLDKYKDLTDPNNDKNVLIDRLQYFGNKPEFSVEMTKFFDNLETRDLQMRYPNMNSEQIQDKINMENRLRELETERAIEKQQRDSVEYETKVKKFSGEIEKYSESRGFTPSTEHIGKFIKEFSGKGLSPENMLPSFIHMFGKELDEAYSKKMESSLLSRLQKNNKTIVPSSTSTGNKKSSSSFDDDIMNALNG